MLLFAVVSHLQTHISNFLVFGFVFGCVFGSLVRIGGSYGDESGEDEELQLKIWIVELDPRV